MSLKFEITRVSCKKWGGRKIQIFLGHHSWTGYFLKKYRRWKKVEHKRKTNYFLCKFSCSFCLNDFIFHSVLKFIVKKHNNKKHKEYLGNGDKRSNKCIQQIISFFFWLKWWRILVRTSFLVLLSETCFPINWTNCCWYFCNGLWTLDEILFFGELYNTWKMYSRLVILSLTKYG
jgi:hypothetical protein